MTIEFAISPDFRFDPKSNRYRWRDTNKFAPKAAILARTRTYIDNQKQALIQLGRDLSDSKIDLIKFQREAVDIVKSLHLSQAMLGRDGIENLKSGDFLAIARELKRQYKDGKDPDTGKPFGLKWLAQDIKDGNVSRAQLLNRLRMFGDASKISFWLMKRQTALDGGMSLARRILNPDAENCPDCFAYAGMGIKPIADLPLPGERCQCRTQCQCSIEFVS